MLLLLTAAAIAAAPLGRADCSAEYAPVQQHIAAMQQAIARGAEDELQGTDLITPLRSCFRRHVMPQLTRAEKNEKMLSTAATDLFAWGRQLALLDMTDSLEPEWTAGTASLERGVEYAYGVAHDRCVRLGDANQIPIMLGLMRWSQLLGMKVGETLDDDIEPCLNGFAFLVEVTIESESTKRGPGSHFDYTAFLKRDPEDPESLIGTGTYSGWLISHRANCSDAAADTPQRFTISGKLESSGAVVDMAAPGAKADPHLMYVLGTTDWDLRPLWGGDGPFATSADEKDALKGMGTTMSGRPIRLTGEVTASTSSTKSDADKCAGVTTQTERVRIVKLAGSARR